MYTCTHGLDFLSYLISSKNTYFIVDCISTQKILNFEKYYYDIVIK